MKETVARYAVVLVLIVLIGIVPPLPLILSIVGVAVVVLGILAVLDARERRLLRFWEGSGLRVLSRADVGGVLQVAVTLQTKSPEPIRMASVRLVSTHQRRKEDLGVAFRAHPGREPPFDAGVLITLGEKDLTPLGPGRHVVEFPISATASPDLDHPDERITTACHLTVVVPGRIAFTSTVRVALTPPLAWQAPWRPKTPEGG